ncbi:MAG: response regulator transcription factor [Oscillospiraceae bacterium]|nr:response regulator transcription factor [Oscillospiraceae bacterium]
MTKKALVIEDEENIAELLQMFLEKDGYVVRIAADGRSGLEQAKSFAPDVILLDIMLPKLDGVQVLKRLREEDGATPVIMLTAKSEPYDKVFALESGADDYITKPFVPKEVIARVHAVSRRTERAADETRNNKILEFDKLLINLDSYVLLVDGKKIETPPKELELLYHLAKAPNRVFTRNQLLDEVWGFDYFGDSRTVDVHIKRLRYKLDGVSDQWTLKTVWSIGYKFETERDASDSDETLI